MQRQQKRKSNVFGLPFFSRKRFFFFFFTFVVWITIAIECIWMAILTICGDAIQYVRQIVATHPYPHTNAFLWAQVQLFDMSVQLASAKSQMSGLCLPFLSFVHSYSISVLFFSSFSHQHFGRDRKKRPKRVITSATFTRIFRVYRVDPQRIHVFRMHLACNINTAFLHTHTYIHMLKYSHLPIVCENLQRMQLCLKHKQHACVGALSFSAQHFSRFVDRLWLRSHVCIMRSALLYIIYNIFSNRYALP